MGFIKSLFSVKTLYALLAIIIPTILIIIAMIYGEYAFYPSRLPIWYFVIVAIFAIISFIVGLKFANMLIKMRNERIRTADKFQSSDDE